jgi:copper chaperone CopZ
MELLKERLSQNPAVDSVQVNPRSGSVLVVGDETERLRNALEQVMWVVDNAGPEGLPEVGVEATVEVVKGLDSHLARLTNGRVTLRALVPAAFISLGMRQLLSQGLTVGSIPWYVLIYYGVDSFLKLYPEHAPQAREGDAKKETP